MNNNFKRFLLLTILFTILIAIFTSMGCWQLRRAHEKQRLLDQANYTTQQLVSLNTLKSGEKEREFTSVRVKGYYDYAHSFFLTNQFYNHRVGRHVITPLIVDKNTVLLVDRGWVPLNKTLSVSKTNKRAVVIRGRLKLIKKNPFISTSVDTSALQGPLRLIQLDPELLTQMWHQEILPFVLLLDPKEAGGFGREWIITTMSPDRHKGYAVQWFGLAIAAVIIYLVLSLRLRK